eukprot:TRINITY_DN1822_c0_g1_i1.p2 TRINITY_DN1822_c0_g1~~TRINITY_DN1822_c0_g1_i1.p2  ORF type:complete len:148 (-),score=52.79 TRINITY_DN1822_c0_g1_i1:836-1279(-)
MLRLTPPGENDVGLVPIVNAVKPQEINKTVDAYMVFHHNNKTGVVVDTTATESEEGKKTLLTGTGTMVNQFYDLVTVFYEWGWGQSFHFAPRHRGESFEASIARHEYYLALKLKLEESHTVLDVGCGVGGPMRNICRFLQVQSYWHQ